MTKGLCVPAPADVKQIEAIIREHVFHDGWSPDTFTGIPEAAAAVAALPRADVSEARDTLGRFSFAMSEPHLSGYRLILGFETLEAVQTAHTAVCNLATAALAAMRPARSGEGEKP